MNCVERIYPQVKEICLETPIRNVRTNSFYKKLGYRPRCDHNFERQQKRTVTVLFSERNDYSYCDPHRDGILSQ